MNEQMPEFTSDNSEIYNEEFNMTELERAVSLCGNTSVGPDMVHYPFFNTAVAGVFNTRLAGGGEGVKRPHVITRERMASERRTTRRSKALDETILKNPLNFPNEVTCHVKVSPKVKIGSFRLRAVETSKLSVLGQNLPRILLKYRARH